MKEKKSKLISIYKKNHKKLLIIPIIMVLISIFAIINTIGNDGTPIYRDVSLKGGLSSIINIQTQISTSEIEKELQKEFPDNSFQISELLENGEKMGFIIDTDLDEEKLKQYIETKFNVNLEFGDNYSSNFISPTLSNSFFKQSIFILLISFVLMSSVIFFYFKTIVPSSAVILSATFDIIVTVGVLDLIGFKISIAGIGALLMIIGYSIDTDVLLTNRVYKEQGDNYFEKAFFAFQTGTLMSFTTLITALSAMILTNSQVIFEIAFILFIGLIVDYISTWVQNNSILLWWLESK